MDDVNSKRLAKFKARIGEALAGTPTDFYRKAVQEVALETGADLLSVAAAIASMVEGGAPVQSSWKDGATPVPAERPERPEPPSGARPRGRSPPNCRRGGRWFTASRDDGHQVTYAWPWATAMARSPAASWGAIATKRACTAHRSMAWISARTTRWCGCRPICRQPCLARLSKVRSAARDSI